MLEKGDATLMFAIDTTGSMRDEIAAAKGIANYIINMPRKFPVDYILSPFNDPGRWKCTSIAEVFLHSIVAIRTVEAIIKEPKL